MNKSQLIEALQSHEQDLIQRMDSAAVEAEKIVPAQHPRKYEQAVKVFEKLQARYSAICEWRNELQADK
jgi:hypothetical protein